MTGPAPEAVLDAAPAPAGRRARLGSILAVVVSLVSLAAVVLWASGQATPRFPTEADDLLLIAAAVGVYALATFVRGWRWHAILREAEIRHRALDAYLLIPVGYMGNAVLPARGGEVLRIFLLAGRTDARRREILGSLVSERLLDAVALALLFVVLTFAGIANAPVGRKWAVLAIALIAAGVAAAGLFLALRRRGRFRRFADAVRPFGWASRKLLGRHGAILGSVTLGIWMLEGAIFWLVAQALDLDVSFLEAVFLLVLAAFFSLVPAAPGYVGTFDAAVIFGLRALDVVGGQAVAYAVLVRFVIFFPITVAGLVVLMVRYGGLSQLRRRPAMASA